MRSGARQARRRQLRHRMLSLALLFTVCLIVARSAQLQVLQGSDWRAASVRQHEKNRPVPAPRGAIYDRNGRELAISRITYSLAVSPRELENPRAAAEVLRDALPLASAKARRIAEGKTSWVVIGGRHSVVLKNQLESRLGKRGLHFEPTVERFYPRGDLAVELLGRIDVSGRGASGLELTFDSVLTGQPGLSVKRQDGKGISDGWLLTAIVEPTPGADIYLTIDSELQALAESVLEDAISESGAQGGDLLIVKPETGELLAAASRREGWIPHLAAATEPYEPGSTLKPFTVAALLSEGYARLEDKVDTGLGTYLTAGRTVHDTRPHGRLSLAEVLEVSSNVGMAKFAERLPRGVQYRYLRDFGFGTPTDLDYPSESAGLLRTPSRWSRQSSASLAIGYEIAVTPLQLAMAYSTLANGGRLMRPLIVKRADNPDGQSRWTTEPQVIRRVITEEIAEQLRAVLAHAVTQGTGRTAGVRGISVAGKTGTALRFSSATGYSGESYTASFVGLIPSDDPELVVLVKLDAPSGAYYGGQTAAPVMRTAVRAALAGSHWSAPPLLGEPDFPDEKAGVSAGRVSAGGPYVFALDAPLMRAQEDATIFNSKLRTVVPDVRGTSIRAAAYRLHDEGWRVVVQGGGRVESMRPSAGSMLERGRVVYIMGGERAPPRNRGDMETG